MRSDQKSKRPKNSSEVKSTKASSKLQAINPNAAGIDIGSRFHYVAIPNGRDDYSVRRFGCYTSDLRALADWLKKCGVTTVAMESTGNYWIHPFQILDEAGIEVILVNPRNLKNVSGRKTDVSDCQWIQQLHSYGLLQGSFRPEFDICVLRSYWRQRDMLIKYASSHVQHMHKALDLMNVQIHKAISDITGVTGLRIVRAILDGVRSPRLLAQMRDPGIKCAEEELIKALEGDYRPEHIFALRQALSLYEFCWQQIGDCDKQIEEYLTQLGAKNPPGTGRGDDKDSSNGDKRKPKKRARGNAPKFDLQTHLINLCGVDVTEIDGISTVTATTVISETGTDMSKWLTSKHFCSWLGICPDNRITGGKVLSRKTRRVVNRATTAFRIAAQSLKASKSALGAYFRRMQSRLGIAAAITATAHKLATLFYNMLKFGKEYVDQGQEYYERRYQERNLKALQKRAENLGFQLVPAAQTVMVS
jgi:transposase